MVVGRHVFYEGHVQGVGFRYSVKQIAKGFDVNGWVRNLSDGRVEMLAGGESVELDQFLIAIRESHLNGNIRHATVAKVPGPGIKGFEIR